MAVAIEGAVIVRDYEGDITNEIVYKQRCDACGYIAPNPPIVVSCMPGGTKMYGCYHAESFVCPFCGKHQEVRLEG
jgi:predicted RNA-binding Zn-ribbon protein involved in translation (DUF1610 family)